MSIKKILLSVGAIGCVALGYFAAQQIDAGRGERLAEAERQRSATQTNVLHDAAMQWADALTRVQGESVLRAFAAGIAPAVMAQRKESLEFAAISLLRVPGVAGIHVLGTNGDVLYSSDAKLTTIGNADYRGAWALQATELVSRPSPRPGVIEFAMPIVQAEKRLAVVWLEFDAARVEDASRPESLQIKKKIDVDVDAQNGSVEPGKAEK